MPQRAERRARAPESYLVPNYRERFTERWELHSMTGLHLVPPNTPGARDWVSRKLTQLSGSPELRRVDGDDDTQLLLTESMGILFLIYLPRRDVEPRPPPKPGAGETVFLGSIDTISGVVQVDLPEGAYVYAGPESGPVGLVLRESRVRVPQPVEADAGRTKISAAINPWGYVEVWVDSARLMPVHD